MIHDTCEQCGLHESQVPPDHVMEPCPCGCGLVLCQACYFDHQEAVA